MIHLELLLYVILLNLIKEINFCELYKGVIKFIFVGIISGK